MEKTLTRLKSNLKARRKLSLPMLVSPFQWNSADNVHVSKTPTTPEPCEATSPDVTVDGADATANEAEGRSSTRGWLSMSRSRAIKTRNKPRRWPSTPAIVVNGVVAVAGSPCAAQSCPLPDEKAPGHGSARLCEPVQVKAADVTPCRRVLPESSLVRLAVRFAFVFEYSIVCFLLLFADTLRPIKTQPQLITPFLTKTKPLPIAAERNSSNSFLSNFLKIYYADLILVGSDN